MTRKELAKIIKDASKELDNPDFYDDLEHPTDVLDGLITALKRIAKEGLQ